MTITLAAVQVNTAGQARMLEGQSLMKCWSDQSQDSMLRSWIFMLKTTARISRILCDYVIIFIKTLIVKEQA